MLILCGWFGRGQASYPQVPNELHCNHMSMRTVINDALKATTSDFKATPLQRTMQALSASQRCANGKPPQLP
jgi:hypothetical protein